MGAGTRTRGRGLVVSFGLTNNGCGSAPSPVPPGRDRRFPVDTLKIDRSLVARLADDPENRAVVRTIIALAKTLNWW